ncbi:MAG: hypothetical protein BIFFINMI_02341 [Phycisphaerae bacterium]|nr:hypothetical protein [Phycisphaerae bacterium]
MSQVESNNRDSDRAAAQPDPGTASGQMVQLARKATARIVTAALEATAESADIERSARQRLADRFPAMSALPSPLRVDPEQIRDFTRSAEYQVLVEDYVAGRIEGHLLTRAMELLNRVLPALFAAM